MALAGRQQISDQDIRTTATTQQGEYLGQQAQTADGRSFRYGKNGTGSGTALVAGQLEQGAVVVAAQTNTVGTTQVVGDSTVAFAVGATAVTADQYRGGYLIVNAGTGAGQALLVRGNTKAAISGTSTLFLKDFFILATSLTDSKFSLNPHPYSAVIQATATLTAPAAGVAVTNLADGSFGWLQTGGPASVLSDSGAAAVGAPITYSDETAGAVGPYETDAVGPVLGYAMIANVSAEYRPNWLTIN